MDRNCLGTRVSETLSSVALRKESVDRNARKIRYVAPDVVALRKESVDRNVSAFDVLAVSAVSLSARRAWIEMHNVPSL